MTTRTIEPTATSPDVTAAVLADLDDLGHRIAEDGPTDHHAELVLLADAVTGAAPAAAEVLRDSAAPDVARLRALAVASAALYRSTAQSPASSCPAGRSTR